MKYNFDEIIDRRNSNCMKYDNCEAIFGKSDILPMWVADTDFRTPHFITDAIQKRASHPVYGYPIIPDSYYQSIIEWQKKRHNWNVQKEWITFSPNVVTGIASLVLSQTMPGDKIIVQPPVYFPFFHVVEANNRVLVENTLAYKNGRYTFDIDQLKKVIDKNTKMLILCSPHNPGGMVWSREELVSLGDICIENNIIVVSDEIHADIIFGAHKHTPFASISEKYAQNSIVSMSASKTFNVAGLSSSYLIIQNKEHKQAYDNFMKGTHIGSGNFFGVIATESAYLNGEEWLEQLKAYLWENYLYFENYINQYIPGIEIIKPESTFLLWLDVSGTGMTGMEAYQKLVDEGLGVSPGKLFGTGGDQFLRINIGCPLSVIKQALEIMKHVFA